MPGRGCFKCKGTEVGTRRLAWLPCRELGACVGGRLNVPMPRPGSALGKWGAYVACDAVVLSGEEVGDLCLPSHLILYV